jgi:hypothetical protein
MTALTSSQIDDMASVMRDGAYRICEEAIGKWMDPNYIRGLEHMAQERKMYWSGIKHGLPTKSAIAAFLRQELGA